MVPVLLFVSSANIEDTQWAVSTEVLAEEAAILDAARPLAVPQIILTDWHGGWEGEYRFQAGHARTNRARSQAMCEWGMESRDWTRCGPTILVPAGQPVLLTVKTEQPRRLRIPDLGIDTAIAPGQPHPVWAEVGTAGEVAILDGLDGTVPIATLKAIPREDYRDWTAPVGCEVPDHKGTCCSFDTSREGAFKKLGCNGCHFDDDSGVGPSLKGLYGREVLLADGTTVIADADYIWESIMVPGARMVAGYENQMPTYMGQVDEERFLLILEYFMVSAEE